MLGDALRVVCVVCAREADGAAWREAAAAGDANLGAGHLQLCVRTSYTYKLI